jgi:CheY-like chemotaxis protein
MYQVMIVDDEPSAVNLTRTLIEKRCENFEVLGSAYSGEEALEKIKEQVPDVLISDIQMTGMSGLELIEKVKEDHPEVMSVLVSGYQEFEYAKKAMHLDVSEYILKPIVPSEFCKVFKRIEDKLKNQYQWRRNNILSRLVNNLPVHGEDLKFFPFRSYYGAIVRLNGLPARFGDRCRVEIFSDNNDWVMTYGRDDQETLYLLPEEIFGDDCVEKIKAHIVKEQPAASYVTTIIEKSSFLRETLAVIFYY